VAEIAHAVDETGFASLWVEDHFIQVPVQGPADDPMLEAYSALGYLAGVTRRVRLGVLVSGNTYRNPGLLVKAVTTVDVLSQGRAYLGVGTGWLRREHEGYGFELPSVAVRFERLEETLQIAKQMWSGSSAPFHGRHYRLAETLCSPMPVSVPHPPILVGGMGEQKTLRLVARYADACNFYIVDRAHGVAPMRAKLDVLRRRCDEVGRPFDAIERTVLLGTGLVAGGESASDLIGTLRELAAAGFQHAILMLTPGRELALVEALAKDVLPEARGF
jgi:F420-dependent oxidoreductase-like protein